MPLDVDTLIDRRKLRRKLTFWRVVAVVAMLVLIGGGSLALLGRDLSHAGNHIARLPIEGMILENRAQLKLIDDLAERDSVKAVIVSINSPGGSTTGGEDLYNALRRLAEKKPVVAEIRTLGASAGYMVALSGERIFARYNTITGSIGVLFQYGNAAKLLDTIGVEMDAVKSAPLKAEPDFYSETSPEARAVLADVVDDSYQWFVKLVAERRGLDLEAARTLADGRIYSGVRALDKGLIDAIGGEREVVAWLVDEKGVPEGLPVLTWDLDKAADDSPFALKMSKGLGAGIAETILQSDYSANRLISPGFMLDGLVSVWQASETEIEK